MSSGISEQFKVDFSIYEKDMSEKAISRILTQFHNSPVLQESLKAFIKNAPQYVYDEILKFQEANSLYMAEGENLDAIGRIVGQPRIPYQFDDSRWFFMDRGGQGFDQGLFWCSPAKLIGTTPANDAQYRMMILARIACNFNRFSSRPELQYLSQFVTGEKVSWAVTGPMEAQIIVRVGISLSKLGYLINFTTNTLADDIPMIPYPATLKITSIMYKPQPREFRFDTEDGHQFDEGKFALSVLIEDEKGLNVR